MTGPSSSLAIRNGSTRGSTRFHRWSSKPCSVAETLDVLATGGHPIPRRFHRHYVVKNVGPGVAVNVHVLTAQVDGRWDIDTVGAMEPGDSRLLPEHADQRLDAHAGRASGRVVVCESIRTRTIPWVVTLNVPDDTGQVRHNFLWDFEEKDASLLDLLRNHGERFTSALDNLRQDVERGPTRGLDVRQSPPQEASGEL